MHTKILRVAVAGLGCETSTFTPARTDARAFDPQRGNEILSEYKFLQKGSALGDAAEWRGALIGHALPGGVVTRDAFEELSAELVTLLRDILMEGSLDGFWFDIHGAMCVESVEDSEAELLRRIRRVIGPETVVSTSMDLHGNVSRDLAHQTDLITCYRTAPHEDVMETKSRACRNLVELLHKRRETAQPDCRTPLPVKAWIPVPILLPGEQTSTRVEPAKHIYAAVPEIEATDGVIDAAIWVGYAWADEARSHAVCVVSGWDEAAVKRGAEKLARILWDAHEKFDFVAPTGQFDECLDAALDSTDTPYFVSDSGDNPTAGGSGDVTWTLKHLLARPEFRDLSGPKTIYASIPGPEAVAIAVNAEINDTVSLTAGAEVDDIHSGPITMSGRVHAIKQGDPQALTEVVLQVGSVFVILTELRKPYHYEHDFTDLHLDIRKDAEIVIVKIGYLEPELYALQRGWMMALTPGGVDQDLVRLGHNKISRPMWPFDRKFEKEPDLRARIIGRSDERLIDLEV